MEYMAGRNLHQYLEAHGRQVHLRHGALKKALYVHTMLSNLRLINIRLSEERSRYLFRQLVEAIEYCHSRSIVHRHVYLILCPIMHYSYTNALCSLLSALLTQRHKTIKYFIGQNTGDSQAH